MIGVSIISDGARVKFDRVLSQAKNPRAVMAGVGREGGNLLKKHFRQKDRTEPNQLGGRREHFWNRVAQSVSAPVTSSDGRTATVTISDPRFGQKLFGGTIAAKRVKNLTIPVEPEAYGRRASVFEKETGLKLFVLTVNAHAFLAARLGDSVKVEYLLTPRVNQKPDPTALPPEKEFEDALISRAQKIVDRQNAGEKPE